MKSENLDVAGVLTIFRHQYSVIALFEAAKTFLALICQGVGSSVKEIETRRDFDRIGKGVHSYKCMDRILKEGKERRSHIKI